MIQGSFLSHAALSAPCLKKGGVPSLCPGSCQRLPPQSLHMPHEPTGPSHDLLELHVPGVKLTFTRIAAAP